MVTRMRIYKINRAERTLFKPRLINSCLRASFVKPSATFQILSIPTLKIPDMKFAIPLVYLASTASAVLPCCPRGEHCCPPNLFSVTKREFQSPNNNANTR